MGLRQVEQGLYSFFKVSWLHLISTLHFEIMKYGKKMQKPIFRLIPCTHILPQDRIIFFICCMLILSVVWPGALRCHQYLLFKFKVFLKHFYNRFNQSHMTLVQHNVHMILIVKYKLYFVWIKQMIYQSGDHIYFLNWQRRPLNICWWYNDGLFCPGQGHHPLHTGQF